MTSAAAAATSAAAAAARGIEHWARERFATGSDADAPAAADVIVRCWLQPPAASPCGGGRSAPARSRAATAAAAP
eukprot:5475421-Pyramimonas_sp.AAC.1